VPFAVNRFRELKQEHWMRLFLAGLMGTFIPAFLFASAQTQISSSLAGILNTLSPVWTVIVGAMIFRQRFRWQAIAGIVVSFGGIILLALSRSGGSITGFNIYALLIVLACFLYGTNLNWIKYEIPDLGAVTITSVALTMIGPLGVVYLFGFTHFTYKVEHVEGAWKAIGFIVLLALMSTTVATLLFNKLVKMTSPLFTSSVTYLMPIVSVMWGLLDGEALLAGHFIGMGCVLVGVYLTTLKPKGV
jgi:drug/metabolite transporter (DMT)-like permease